MLSLPVRLQQWRPTGQTGLLHAWKGRRHGREQTARASGETRADSLALGGAWGDVLFPKPALALCNQEPGITCPSLAAMTESQIILTFA